MIELTFKTCIGKRCTNTFRVFPAHAQEWCSVHCRDDHEGRGWATIKTALTDKDKRGEKNHTEDERARRRFNHELNAVGYAEAVSEWEIRNKKKHTRSEE